MKKTLIVTVLAVFTLVLGYVLRPTDTPYMGVEANPPAEAESTTATFPDGDVPAEADTEAAPAEEAAEPEEATDSEN
ncbi:MAG: hypothetical protein R3B54_06680 [Bdellovibrionota bacterium]